MQTWVRGGYVARKPTQPIVGEGFHARTASVYGRPRFARTKWCAGCARVISYVGGGRKAGAPYQPRVLSATPAIRTQPAPAVTRTRGVGDAAPYGQQRNERCGMERNGHGQTYTSPFTHLTAPLKHTL